MAQDLHDSSEVPLFIIVGFQTNKSGDPHLIMQVLKMLNSTRYPATDYNISFLSQQSSRGYGDAALFRSKFFNMDELVSTQTFPPRIIEPSALCFCLTFPSKVKG